jgi:metallo-beta-lactamase class B
MKNLFVMLMAVLMSLSAPGRTSAVQADASWREPFNAFRIVGNVYYVGTRGLSSFLIATPDGHVLIETGLRSSVPLITANIERLGFKVSDIKILLTGHAHFDHVGGHAEMQRLSGARVIVMREDADALASGIDKSALGAEGWAPVKVDQALDDGDTVKLGGMTLTAHRTPGHTQGCTTWTTSVQQDGQTYRVVFAGSTSINDGVRFAGNTRHPAIAQDYARGFAFLKSLTPDIWLAQHPQVFGLEAKALRLKAGDQPNPFVDRAGYTSYIARSEQLYLAQLKKEGVVSR